MASLNCQLSAYPDYLVQRMGLDFTERYHTDCEYHNAQWKNILRWLHANFGRWGCGQADPPDSYVASTLGSVHLFSWLFGSDVVYSPIQFPETPIYPLADLADLFQFGPTEIVTRRLDSLLDLTRRLLDRYGSDPFTVPFHSPEMDGVDDLDNTHCPLTIAYKLFGERILMDLYDNPEGVRHVFRRIMEMTQELGRRFRDLAGLPHPRHVLMSACSACFISPQQWEEMLLPLLREYCGGRPMFFHSCGSVNNHLPAFGRLSRTTPFLKFDCRESAGINVRAAAREMPGIEISYMFSPALCLTRSPQQMADAVRQTVDKAQGSPMNLILMLPRGTSDALVNAFFETCVDLGAPIKLDSGFRFV